MIRDSDSQAVRSNVCAKMHRSENHSFMTSQRALKYHIHIQDHKITFLVGLIILITLMNMTSQLKSLVIDNFIFIFKFSIYRYIYFFLILMSNIEKNTVCFWHIYTSIYAEIYQNHDATVNIFGSVSLSKYKHINTALLPKILLLIRLSSELWQMAVTLHD